MANELLEILLFTGSSIFLFISFISCHWIYSGAPWPFRKRVERKQLSSARSGRTEEKLDYSRTLSDPNIHLPWSYKKGLMNITHMDVNKWIEIDKEIVSQIILADSSASVQNSFVIKREYQNEVNVASFELLEQIIDHIVDNPEFQSIVNIRCIHEEKSI